MWPGPSRNIVGAASLSLVAAAPGGPADVLPLREAAPSSGPGGAVRVYPGLSGLERLRPDWETIAAPWGSPMMSPAWIQAWAEVYGLEQDVEFRVAGDRSVRAIAPLVRSRSGGLRLELAGPDNLIESMDFLYEGEAHVPALARDLVRSRIPLRFWRVPADSPMVPAVLGAARGRGLVRCQPAAACPSLALDATWAEPLEHLEAHRRSNVRRARRIAESMGALTTEILVPAPGGVGRLLDEAFAVEAAGWKSREGSPLARDRLLGEFFRRYAVLAAAEGQFRVGFLRIGGRAAAMKLAAVVGGRFWLLAMGFSEEFERCSPGTLLLVDTLAYAAREGLRSYEFLGADEAWVRAWGPVQRPHVSIRTYPVGIRGAVALAADGADLAASKVRGARAWVDRTYLDVQHHLALAYSAGPTPEDALRTASSFAGDGYPGILGYINAGNEDPRLVARNSLAALEGIAAGRLDCYLSIKEPALRFDRALTESIVRSGRDKGIRVHFDALSPNDVDRTFALAPEAGSQRLRDLINKGIDEEQIVAAAELLAEGGILNLKLYFLIGLPSEMLEDIEELLALTARLRQAWLDRQRPLGRLGALTLSVNPFIPKPFTPFQWAPMEQAKSLEVKVRRLRAAIARMPNTSLICESLRAAALQAFLSRGDRRVGRTLPALAQGANLRAACREAGLDPDFYVTRERGEGEIFPWEVIDNGVRRDYLRREYRRGLEGSFTPPCRPGCRRCGVCGEAF